MCTATFDKIKRMSEASASGGNLLLRPTTQKDLIRFLRSKELKYPLASNL